MPNPLDVVLEISLVQNKPDLIKRLFPFVLILKNYVKLSALQSITPKGVSRNQLLNDLLAVALDQVESSLPDGASDAYEHALVENEEGLTMLLEQEGHL